MTSNARLRNLSFSHCGGVHRISEGVFKSAALGNLIWWFSSAAELGDELDGSKQVI